MDDGDNYFVSDRSGKCYVTYDLVFELVRSFSFLMVVPLIVMMVVIVMTTAMTRPTTWSLTRCTEKKQCESLPQQGNHLYSIWH